MSKARKGGESVSKARKGGSLNVRITFVLEIGEFYIENPFFDINDINDREELESNKPLTIKLCKFYLGRNLSFTSYDLFMHTFV